MNLRTFLFGKPLPSDAEAEEQIGPAQGIPVLGLDALASASYGPEAALTVLLVSGAAASQAIVPVSAAIIALLFLVYLSYRQTIAAYPNGGGSFTVADENLGATAGLIAAVALAVDYILNAAVAISAGVGAIVSAVPALLPHTLELCLAVIEAVSNAVPLFRRPTVRLARVMLTLIVTILVCSPDLRCWFAPTASRRRPLGNLGFRV